MSVKIVLAIVSLFSLYQLNKLDNLSDELLLDQQVADSLENVIILNDSIIISLKSEYLIAVEQVHRDSINVDNFKKNKPKQLKGLNREELNSKFNSYFKRNRSK